jgi:exodeoxyribonuclease-3
VEFSGQKSHAGVAIISKQKAENIITGFDDGVDKVRLLRIKYQGLHIINTYVPQGRDIESEHYQYKLDWYTKFLNLLNYHYKPSESIIWVGDFNVAPEDIDVYSPNTLRNNPDFHVDVQQALEKVREWGFVDIFRKHHPNEPEQFTYFDYRMRNAVKRKAGWRIDHIWTTESISQFSTDCWIDLDARTHERPSDHTFLIADFYIKE